MAMDTGTIDSSEQPNQLRRDAISLIGRVNNSAKKYLREDHLKKIKYMHEFFLNFLLIESTMKKLATKMVTQSNNIAKEIISRKQKNCHYEAEERPVTGSQCYFFCVLRRVAWAAARREIGIRYGEVLT